MISVEEADRFVVATAASCRERREQNGHSPVDGETCPLSEATGRILAQAVRTDRDVPPFDRVAMDGIAVCFDSLRSAAGGHPAPLRLRIASTQAAGEAPHTLPGKETGKETCIEIMTGAALPHGCDTIIPYERIDIHEGHALVRDPEGVTRGQHLHSRGSDAAKGTVIMPEGTRIGPAHVAALASGGCDPVQVARQPRLAILTTGNELVPVTGRVLPHQIRRSNEFALQAALGARGYASAHHEHVLDDEDALQKAVVNARRQTDVILLTGGVSAGKFDLVPDVLRRAGVQEVFHKIRQKPGKPLWFGLTGQGQAVFGLPGNPVSALVATVRYVVPFLSLLSGVTPPEPFKLTTTDIPTRRNDFTHFTLVKRRGMRATPVASRGSGDLIAPLGSDGFVEIPPDMTQPGPVSFYPWM